MIIANSVFATLCSLVIVLITCCDVTLGAPQWGVAAAAESANNIDQQQQGTTAAPAPQAVAASGSGYYGGYPYNPYYYGYGYQPPAPQSPPKQQTTPPGWGWGYQGLPWWGFYGYWKG